MSMLGLGLSVCNQSFDRLGALDSSEKCWEFDGVNEYVSCVSDSVFNHQTALSVSKFSLSLWFKTSNDSDIGYLGALASYNSGGTEKKDWQILFSQPANIIMLLTWASNTSIASILANFANEAGDLADGNWRHMVITYDGSVAFATKRGTIYINGYKMPQVNNSGSSPAQIDQDVSGFAIGNRWSDSTNAPFDGRIDEVFYVNQYVLSQSEVYQLYNGRVTHDLAGFLPAETRAYWRMGDGDNASAGGVKDAIGTNHMTSVNLGAGDIITDAP